MGAIMFLFDIPLEVAYQCLAFIAIFVIRENTSCLLGDICSIDF